MKDEPTIGSPPMPDDRRVAEPHLRQLVADLVRQRARARDEADVARGEDLRGDDPDVRLAGRERARAVRPEQPDAPRADVGVDAEHLVRGDALGDADDRVDAGVDRLVDRVGGERRRDEDHRRVRAVLAHRLGDRVEDGHAVDVLAALPGRDARRRDSCRRRGCAGRGSGPPSRSGPGRRGACRCRRGSPSEQPFTARIAILSSVSRPSATRSPSSASTRARPPRPRSPCARATRRSRRCASKKRTSSIPRPASSTRRAPLGLGVVAHVRRVAAASRPPRRRRPCRRCRRAARGRGSRAPSRATAAPRSAKWCAAVRQATTSKRRPRRAATRRGRSTSGRMPGAGSHVTTSSPASRSRRATWPPPVATSSAVRAPAAHADELLEVARRRDARPTRRTPRARSLQSTLVTRPAPRRASPPRASSGETRRFGGAASARIVPPLLGVRAVEADDDRQLERHLPERLQDPARDLVAARDARRRC